MTFYKSFILGVGLTVSACNAQTEQTEQTPDFFDLMATPIGDVTFPSSCNAEASPMVERGVAFLHHMMYDEADFVFNMAANADQECAMAHWGMAMAIIHPLWPGAPSADDLSRGIAHTVKAQSIAGVSNREKAYVETTRAYFEDAQSFSVPERLKKFETAWKQVNDQYPDDLEARAFYALSYLATSDKADTSYHQQNAAASIAETILVDNPNHPGAHHYIIHAYDVPGNASKAASVADHYGEIAPKVPHAAHMISHIYIRLGDWEKSIVWNTVSSETAWELCVSSGEVNDHFTHALDYLTYAYLQKGDDEAVQKILQNTAELKPPYNKTNHASAYAFAAIPARYAIERRDWKNAVELQPRMPADFPWDPSHDPYVAMTHFARAIAFSRLGKPEAAETEISALDQLITSIKSKSPYWALQVDIQKRAAQAWQVYARGDTEGGLRKMFEAAQLELSTQKHPITPGSIVPAYELYGDMLLDAGSNDKAIEAYKVSLQRNPNRFNTLVGISRAAMNMGNIEEVQKHYLQLASLIGDNSIQRPAVRQIQDYLEKG